MLTWSTATTPSSSPRRRFTSKRLTRSRTEMDAPAVMRPSLASPATTLSQCRTRTILSRRASSRGRRPIGPEPPWEVAVPVHHAVLALLAAGPSHGYELKQQFEDAVGPQWGSPNIGHLY